MKKGIFLRQTLCPNEGHHTPPPLFETFVDVDVDVVVRKTQVIKDGFYRLLRSYIHDRFLEYILGTCRHSIRRSGLRRSFEGPCVFYQTQAEFVFLDGRKSSLPLPSLALPCLSKVI